MAYNSIFTGAQIDEAVDRALGGAPFGSQITADYTLALEDAGKMFLVNSSSAVTITVSSDVDFPVGTEIEFCRFGSGAVTFAESGTTIYSVSNAKSIADQYGCVCLKRIGTNWLLAGGLG